MRCTICMTKGDTLLNIYDECVKAGSPDLPIIFHFYF